ncbi:hypothetical protein ARMGADRAFT_1067623 [Armillaria gallica]|uniref:MARVEL domain-containing protein n=1 Tax=Armillaria gallica TaxID=47427 RepID=A0A2H3CZH5_ARMGA|nr:hypothetical protein ARMGADRAFT_1067623 [Armillaria gallica]
MRGTYNYTLRRVALYALLWPMAVILLGLTAYRIHFTKRQGAGYQPIIVELLVASIFTLLWVPLAMFMIFAERASSSRDNNASTSRAHPKHLPFELLGLGILWLLWLVGAVYTTNRVLPGRNWCGGFSGKQCNILTAILAFAWIGWSLLTLLGILALMHSAHGFASDGNAGTGVEKDRGAASKTTHTGTGQPVPTQPTNV